MGLISCYSELTVQLSQKSSCSSYKNVASSISSNLAQTTSTNVYKTTLSTGLHHLITVTWSRTATTHGLHITSGDDTTMGFRLNTNSRLFRKKRGSKAFEVKNSKFEVFYDLSSAQYGAGAEPIERYYVIIMVDAELGLALGDMYEEAVYKKVKIDIENLRYNLISRRECIYGNTLGSTKARFSDGGGWHDVVIRCTGEGEGVKGSGLVVCVDKRVVVRVKRLRWNFRGNQTVFVDGLAVDVMWDVHDWFFASESGSGSGSGSGHGVFMFRTRNGLDGMLWMEDEEKEFTLLVYATKS